MPIGDPPPSGSVASGTITALKSGSYNSSTNGFTYQGQDYILGVQRGSSASELQWFHGTTSQVATNSNVAALMSSGTWDVVHDGSYSGGTYSYNGKSYEIRMLEDSGKIWAKAVAV